MVLPERVLEFRGKDSSSRRLRLVALRRGVFAAELGIGAVLVGHEIRFAVGDLGRGLGESFGRRILDVEKWRLLTPSPPTSGIRNLRGAIALTWTEDKYRGRMSVY